jgi:hypothetical protein
MRYRGRRSCEVAALMRHYLSFLIRECCGKYHLLVHFSTGGHRHPTIQSRVAVSILHQVSERPRE